jgi:hypothetical protein
MMYNQLQGSQEDGSFYLKIAIVSVFLRLKLTKCTKFSFVLVELLLLFYLMNY